MRATLQPPVVAAPQSPAVTGWRNTGAVAGTSLTAWMASDDAPTSPRAMNGDACAAASTAGVRKRK